MPPGTDPGDPRQAGVRSSDAIALGLLHGPTELLPISSSGHLTLVPWILGLPYASLPSGRRKTLEIALHAGTAAAVAIAPPTGPVKTTRGKRSAILAASSLAPTAVAGLLLRKPVRERLGTPGTVAAGLLAGSAGLVLAERQSGNRQAVDLQPADAAVIGMVQAASLWPGVSRSAMAILGARMRGFAPGDSARIARSGLVATSFAAAGLEAVEAAREGRARADSAALAAGAAAAFGSALLARPLVRRLESGGRLWPWALLRTATAAATLLRIRSLGDDGER